MPKSNISSIYYEDIEDGWISSDKEAWTYVSADKPTYVFSILGNVSTKYYAGIKLKYKQSGTVKYAIITKVGSYSGGSTQITIYGGGGDYPTTTNANDVVYPMTSATISEKFYSTSGNPVGFPKEQSVWSYIVQYSGDFTTNSTAWIETDPLLRVRCPIGSWKITWSGDVRGWDGGDDFGGAVAISNLNNSPNIYGLSAPLIGGVCYNWYYHMAHIFMEANYTVTTKTLLYTIFRAWNGGGNIRIEGSAGRTLITLTNVYY